MKIGLLGYGVVGAGVFDLCAANKQLEITSVLCRHPDRVPQCKGTIDAFGLTQDDSIDTIVEVLGGLHPAYELVSTALRAGKNVVTANKHLICQYYTELTELAAANGAALRCTAAVGGGIPWLTNLERAARCSTVDRVGGIMNGTTNYILDTMHHSPLPFDEVLASAQRLGYAEADPSADIDGLDICRKLAISANIAFGCCIGEQDILTEGIRYVQAADIAAFAAHGYTCKLLADAGLQPDGSVYALLEPSLLGPDWPEASVPANYNLVSLWSDVLGKQSYFGQGAGQEPTACNVVQDLLDIQNGTRKFYTDKKSPRAVDNTGLCRRYYVRTAVDSDWLAEHTETHWPQGGVITQPLAPPQMHAAAQQLRQKDPDTFFACIL